MEEFSYNNKKINVDDNKNITGLVDKQRNVTVVMNVMGGLDSKAEILQLKQEVSELRTIIEGINR